MRSVVDWSGPHLPQRLPGADRGFFWARPVFAGAGQRRRLPRRAGGRRRSLVESNLLAAVFMRCLGSGTILLPPAMHSLCRVFFFRNREIGSVQSANAGRADQVTNWFRKLIKIEFHLVTVGTCIPSMVILLRTEKVIVRARREAELPLTILMTLPFNVRLVCLNAHDVASAALSVAIGIGTGDSFHDTVSNVISFYDAVMRDKKLLTAEA